MTRIKLAFQRIHNEALTISVARATAESVLDSIRPQLIGRRFDAIRLGKLRGEYEITHVEISADGEVRAHGRKVRSSGKLGDKVWDLGILYPGKMGL